MLPHLKLLWGDNEKFFNFIEANGFVRLSEVLIYQELILTYNNLIKVIKIKVLTGQCF